jgi:tRNA nucleotidyltransferase/poly(A) polymerase
MKLFEVGGCVRDELLGLHTKDIDFTVELDDLTLSVDEGWEKMVLRYF